MSYGGRWTRTWDIWIDYLIVLRLANCATQVGMLTLSNVPSLSNCFIFEGGGGVGGGGDYGRGVFGGGVLVGGFMSRGVLSTGGFLSGGFCPWGFLS